MAIRGIPDWLTSFLDRHATLFLTDSHTELLSDFNIPLVVFSPNGFELEYNAESRRELFRRLRSRLTELDVDRLEWTLCEFEMNSPDRPTALVEWRYVAGQETREISKLRYFFQKRDGRWRIHMIERVKFTLLDPLAGPAAKTLH